MDHIGDPHQEIAGTCTDKGWLSLFKNDWAGSFFIARRNSWVSHPKGYFQPGVLVLNNEGRVLYRWRCRPSRKNIGGAIARPTPEHVWENIQPALEQPAGAPDVDYDDDPVLDSPDVPWPIFVTLLVSNGWFLRPKAFGQEPGVDTVKKRQQNAALRVPFFLLAWVIAAVFLPAWVVVIVFAAWIAKVTPGILEVNRIFQNVAPGEEPG